MDNPRLGFPLSILSTCAHSATDKARLPVLPPCETVLFLVCIWLVEWLILPLNRSSMGSFFLKKIDNESCIKLKWAFATRTLCPLCPLDGDNGNGILYIVAQTLPFWLRKLQLLCNSCLKSLTPVWRPVSSVWSFFLPYKRMKLLGR